MVWLRFGRISRVVKLETGDDVPRDPIVVSSSQNDEAPRIRRVEHITGIKRESTHGGDNRVLPSRDKVSRQGLDQIFSHQFYISAAP
jgi:hypothetical protein